MNRLSMDRLIWGQGKETRTKNNWSGIQKIESGKGEKGV